MTPFDETALLTMLLAFYPAPSGAALRRARAERPEYFAGGELFGTHGDKFRLPDGRVFDLIFDVDGVSGGPKWQVIVPGPGGDESPWPLERGPLASIDAAVAWPPPVATTFEDLVSAHLADVSGAERAIEVKAGELAIAGGATEADAVYEDSVGRAASALDEHLRAFDDLNPSDVAAITNALTHTIGDERVDAADLEANAPGEMGDIGMSLPPRPERPPPDVPPPRTE